MPIVLRELKKERDVKREELIKDAAWAFGSAAGLFSFSVALLLGMISDLGAFSGTGSAVVFAAGMVYFVYAGVLNALKVLAPAEDTE